MKKLFSILLLFASIASFSQTVKNDTDLSAESTNEIKNKALNQTRLDNFNQNAIVSKVSTLQGFVSATGTTYTITNSDRDKLIILSNAAGCTVTMDDAVTIGYRFNFRRTSTAGTITFVSDGTSILDFPGSANTTSDQTTLETDRATATFIKRTSTTFDGIGQLGPAAVGGVTDVTGTTNRITSTGGTTPQIDISTSYAGQNSITNVGTLTAGSTGVGFTIALATSTVTGLGTGVLTALGVNVGTAGSVIVNGGALGTPSSGVATNLTGTASGLTAGNVTTNANLTGDVTSSGNATTLATVNSNVGTFGSATQASQVTVNAKGLVTAASNVTVTPAIGSITGLGTGVATALAVNTGSAGAFVVNGGALGTPSSGTATNLTGTASGLTAGNVTTNANLTGHVTSTGNAAVLGSFSSSNLSTALTDEVGTGLVGLSRTPLNTQTASYTLAASDEWKEVQINAAGATNLTLPPDATTPVGFRCTFRRLGAGQTTFVNGSGVTSTFSANVALDAGQYNLVDIFKDAADHYEISNGSVASAAALTSSNTYFTATIGGSPSVALLAAASVGVKFTGITGSLATGDLVQVSAADTWSALSSVSAGSMLRSGGVSTVSAWSTTKWPNTTTANRILFSSATNTISDDADLTFDGTSMTITGKILFDATLTAGGTTGNQTINKPAGSVNIAAAGTTVTVTNSFVTTSSLVWAWCMTNDATAYVKNVTVASGSFVVNLGAAATAETKIGFIVHN